MGIFDWFKKEPRKKESEDYYVKDTVTGEIIKVSKEDAQEVANDYVEHLKGNTTFKSKRNKEESRKNDIGDLDSNFESNEWTNEELAVLYGILFEIDWADGELNRGSDNSIMAQSLMMAMTINMSDEERNLIEDWTEYSERIMEIQSFAEKIYLINEAEGDTRKIKNDFVKLDIPKKYHVSQSATILIEADREINQKKVAVAGFFGVPLQLKNK